MYVDGKVFDVTKAKVAVPITAFEMGACRYQKGTLYLAPKGTWVCKMESNGVGCIVAVTSEKAKKYLIGAGRIDLVEKYFGKLEKA